MKDQSASSRTTARAKQLLDAAVFAFLALAVWEMWPLVDGAPEQPLTQVRDVPWLPTLAFVMCWGLVTAQSLLKRRPIEVKAAIARGLSISGGLALVLLALALSFRWTWGLVMAMHFVSVIVSHIAMKVAFVEKLK